MNNPHKLEDCLEKIGISTRYLLSMISDILDMSCIESGKLMIVEKKFNLHTLVQGIVIMITPQIAEKHQHFELYVDEAAAGNYLGDELRINQSLMNLLNNAIKYTGQEGEISLEIRRKMRKGNQALIQMIVKDTGVGISKEFKKTFKRAVVVLFRRTVCITRVLSPESRKTHLRKDNLKEAGSACR